MNRKQLTEEFDQLTWLDKLHVLFIVKVRNFRRVRPVDMLPLVIILQTISMIVYLPGRDFVNLAISQLAIVILSITPGLSRSFSNGKV